MQESSSKDRLHRTNGSVIPLLDKVGYGSGNLTYGIVFQLVATYVVFYSTAILGVPGSIIGTVVGLSVIWDGVSDPLMGYISDHTRFRRFGRRHFYLLSGCMLIAVSNYFLWVIDPGLSTGLKTAYLAILLFVIKTAMTIYSVPHTALGAELSDDYNERSSIQGIKTIFFILGLFGATVMGMFLFFNPMPEYPQGQLNPAAYRNMGLTSSVIALVFGLVCFFSTKKYIQYLPMPDDKGGSDHEKKGSILNDVKQAFSNADYRLVVTGYLLTNIASALISSIGMHVFTYTFQFNNTAIAVIFGVLFGMCVLSQLVWVKISTMLDKKRTVVSGLSASLLGALYFLVLVFFRDAVTGKVLYFIPFAALSGFGMGGLFSLPLSMIADTIDVEELSTGFRNEGVFYGCMTLCYKLSQAVAIFLLGILLDLVGFDAEAVSQPRATLMTLGLILAIGCIVSLVAAMLAYSGYSLNKQKVESIQRQIQERQQKTNSKN
ncbi:MAG TPA: MFS transporter [Candidatus Atribacteria bacterium]|nr:MFS transporter [Candidatus Atribacteria bacterium]